MCLNVEGCVQPIGPRPLDARRRRRLGYTRDAPPHRDRNRGLQSTHLLTGVLEHLGHNARADCG